MERSYSFGYWLRRSRKALDLTQEELAQQVGCVVTTIKKIEADVRRPSKQLAARLAEMLAIPAEERPAFLQAARAERAVDQLTLPALPKDLAPAAGTLLSMCPVCGTSNAAGSRFCSTCGAALEQATLPPAVIGKAPSDLPREERRWATVLFADISGYTSMSERMDPEDVNVLAARCIERMGEQVRHFGGTVVNVMGDAVLAVFGAPLAHEDDAERAVRAAIAMRDNPLPDYPMHTLQLHIGINTGEVLATLLGPVERRDYTVLGDPVNTASRILHAAPAGVVLVGEETYRATRQVVRYRELSPLVARRKEQLVHVWEALTVAEVPAARPLGLAPFAGRDEDLALLSGIWNKLTREAQRFGREHEAWPMLARAMAMSAGYHVDVFDFAGHETIAEETRDLASSVNFLPPLVSASIDLLYNFVRRREVGRAEQILKEVADKAEKAAGFHGWLWRLRLAQARAELALARGDWEETLRLVEAAIAHSQTRGRVKHQAFGLETRARALAALGRKHEAIAEARNAVNLIRPIESPALLLRTAAALLDLEGDDALLAEARAAAQRVAAALPNEEMRRRFEAAEPMRLLSKLIR